MIRLRDAVVGLFVGATVTLLPGCLSTHPASSSSAYVEIDGASAERIHQEILRVFRDADYRTVADQGDQMTFERPGTQRDVVLHGGLAPSEMIIRVEVSIRPFAKGTELVRADAFVVDDGMVSKQLKRLSARPYQTLLNRVKANMVSSAAVP